MYWLTPFRYLLEGYLGVVTNKIPVRCSENEFARFRPPPGLTCEDYAGPFVEQRGGYVITDGSGMCALCQYANGNEFAASFNVFYKYKWRDYVNLGDILVLCCFQHSCRLYPLLVISTWISSAEEEVEFANDERDKVSEDVYRPGCDSHKADLHAFIWYRDI
ncbi:ATP-binding multidrug cassette transport protein [Coccidioides immitis RMSCC 3703]|uniref:ATP-binding multidrug cassette transport protein n=2 Tax=Coccidioides immitis TaxID=5501 RepID=A0A0J8QPZ2_COCIT|nr:ATP-binding multidrug cassette transport protein [Coccidioides immitis RMSCC 3703]